MNIRFFRKRNILNRILLCAIFMLGAATLLFHNAAIRDEVSARRIEEKRDERERAVLNREAAYLHFSLFSLRNHAREMGLVPITDPQFVRRGEEKPSFAARSGE